jgi:hypothetical protein
MAKDWIALIIQAVDSLGKSLQESSNEGVAGFGTVIDKLVSMKSALAGLGGPITLILSVMKDVDEENQEIIDNIDSQMKTLTRQLTTEASNLQLSLLDMQEKFLKDAAIKKSGILAVNEEINQKEKELAELKYEDELAQLDLDIQAAKDANDEKLANEKQLEKDLLILKADAAAKELQLEKDNAKIEKQIELQKMAIRKEQLKLENKLRKEEIKLQKQEAMAAAGKITGKDEREKYVKEVTNGYNDILDTFDEISKVQMDLLNKEEEAIKNDITGSYAVGSDYIPKNQIAKIHQGERIIPAAMNIPGMSNADFVDSALRGLQFGQGQNYNTNNSTTNNQRYYNLNGVTIKSNNATNLLKQIQDLAENTGSRLFTR